MLRRVTRIAFIFCMVHARAALVQDGGDYGAQQASDRFKPVNGMGLRSSRTNWKDGPGLAS